ncbi:tetratricopeptide repeat protein [Chondromyces apiculatus]|uniref:Tetratricopeptide repeat protein n=1 Tax=Chondromyces apiculatus DSM 436 TaxID=1192034 RepID=A0A017T9F5_9BACT|nr:tetratricopeptide repeat protein [Chondromyces apiculatus]EYF05908.1 Hypothetical protein CAP_2910 [Chondromyces apiculatus DSM 436]
MIARRTRHLVPPIPRVLRLACACITGASLTALLPACDRTSSPSSPAPTASSPTSSAAPTAASSPSSPASSPDPRALALQPPTGSTAADTDLRALIQRASRGETPPDTWVLLGHAWIRKARHAASPALHRNAAAAADLALARDPHHRPALNLRALVLLLDHDHAAARDLAEQILAADPRDPAAHGTLSDALLALGKFPDAARAAQTMVDLKPDLASYARASRLRWLEGDVEGAKRIARLAMNAYDPADPEPYAWVLVQAALIFWHEGDREGADRGFDRALDAFSEYPPALRGKARVALANGDAPRALALATRALAQTPTDPETTWLLGDAQQAAGTLDAAHRTHEQALTLARKSKGRVLLAELLLAAAASPSAPSPSAPSPSAPSPSAAAPPLPPPEPPAARIAEALRLLDAERTARGGATDIATDDLYAWALYRAGRIPEARAASDRARALGTRDARLLYHAGAIRLATDDRRDRSEAVKLLASALKLNPRFHPTEAAAAEHLLTQARAADAPAH